MITIGLVLCVGALTWFVGSRSLAGGISLVLAVGYVYGLVRANVPVTATYLLFDVAVLGLYASQASRFDQLRMAGGSQLWAFVVLLFTWPLALFFFSEGDLLVQLVGLRANVFLLPFLLLGASLTDRDVERLAIAVAGLNLFAFAVAAGEYVFGLDAFLPNNEATALIYRSNDVVNYSAYRIPSTFGTAHVYAGTMVMTLPLLLGLQWQRGLSRRLSWFIGAAVIAALLGVFMAATRTHMIMLAILVVAATFSFSVGSRQWLRWVAIVAIGAGVVANEARLQRFSTLAETGSVVERLSASVNGRFFDVAAEYPLGNGLAAGGTNLPHFLQDRVNPLDQGFWLENEYARMVLELGLPGLTLWLALIAWVLMKRPGRETGRWRLGRRLAWINGVAYFASGAIGIGLLVAIPQSCLWLLSLGWVTRQPRRVASRARVAAPALAPSRSSGLASS